MQLIEFAQDVPFLRTLPTKIESPSKRKRAKLRIKKLDQNLDFELPFARFFIAIKFIVDNL